MLLSMRIVLAIGHRPVSQIPIAFSVTDLAVHLYRDHYTTSKTSNMFSSSFVSVVRREERNIGSMHQIVYRWATVSSIHKIDTHSTIISVTRRLRLYMKCKIYNFASLNGT